MQVGRRQVLRWIGMTTVGALAWGATERLTEALAAQGGAPPLYWMTGNANHLNLLAQLGQMQPTFLDLVAGQWELVAYDPLQPAGTPFPDPPPGAPVLIVEALPDPNAAADWTRLGDWVRQSKAVLALGTDACYGGSATPPASAQRLGKLCHQGQTPLIKLPGIPVPPQHLVGTLAHLQFLGFPRVDGQLRPTLYYGQVLCEHCERRGDLEAGRYAAAWGQGGCLLRLGCKGPITHNSCSAVRWNGGSNWCVGAGGPCTGCAEPGFPDHDGLGLYGRLPGDVLGPRSPVLQSLDVLGKGLLGAAVAGIGLHVLRRRLERRSAAKGPARPPLPEPAAPPPPPEEP